MTARAWAELAVNDPPRSIKTQNVEFVNFFELQVSTTG